MVHLSTHFMNILRVLYETLKNFINAATTLNYHDYSGNYTGTILKMYAEVSRYLIQVHIIVCRDHKNI